MSSALIKDVTEFVLDGTHASPVRTEVGIPVLSAQNVKDGRLNFETDRYTSDAEYDAFKKRLPLAVGDVLLTIVGTIGRAAVVDEIRPLVFQRSVAVVRPKQGDLWPRFLYHVSQTQEFQAQLARSSNQSSQAGVYLGKLKELRVPLPPLPEQRRIAEILDKADALRAKRRAALAQLDTLTQSIFLDMFGDPATNPKRWPTATLEEISLGGTEGLKRGPFGGALKKEIFVKSGYKVYEQQHAIYKTFSIGNYYISELKYLGMRAFTVGPGDFIVSCSGTVGRTYRLPPSAPNGVINQALLRMRIDETQVEPVFFEALFESSAFQRRLLGGARGTGIDNFPPMERIRSTAVIVPPIGLQRKFVERLEQEEELRRLHGASMRELETLFASLQHSAFQGEL